MLLTLPFGGAQGEGGILQNLANNDEFPLFDCERLKRITKLIQFSEGMGRNRAKRLTIL